jgi:molybdate transport system substrate-binding protein
VTRRGAVLAATAGAAVLAVTACGSSGTSASGGTGSGSSGGGKLSGTVIVFAAASLNGAFDKLGAQFRRAHPGVTMKFSYAGSSAIATQLRQGARADLFASASPANMTDVTSDHLTAGQPRVFARNSLEIMVAKGNPDKITSVSDLSRSSVKVAVCAPAVPCGAYSTKVFRKAGVTVHPVSQEPSVSSVVTKVTLGEADAGIVYTTDVRAAGGKVTGVAIPASQNVTADYPIAALKDAPNPAASDAFMRYVLSPAGRQVLTSYGFRPPSGS